MTNVGASPRLVIWRQTPSVFYAKTWTLKTEHEYDLYVYQNDSKRQNYAKLCAKMYKKKRRLTELVHFYI